MVQTSKKFTFFLSFCLPLLAMGIEPPREAYDSEIPEDFEGNAIVLNEIPEDTTISEHLFFESELEKNDGTLPVRTYGTAEWQKKFAEFKKDPAGYLHIRFYKDAAKSLSTKHNKWSRQFGTTAWIVNGQIKGWDAYIISTGKPHRDGGSYTGSGHFSIDWLSKHHRSRAYHNAKMPFAMFFNGGIATHSGNATGYLASHGCVRTPYQTAKQNWNLITKFKKAKAIISILGSSRAAHRNLPFGRNPNMPSHIAVKGMPNWKEFSTQEISNRINKSPINKKSQSFANYWKKFTTLPSKVAPKAIPVAEDDEEHVPHIQQRTSF